MKRIYHNVEIKHHLPNGNKRIDAILGIKSNNNFKEIWRYRKIEYENGHPVFFTDFAYNLLKDKLDILEKELGITRDKITVWRYVRNSSECNFEMHPKEMAKFVELGIVFCMTCYEM